METKGTCKHGEFTLTEGCEKCIAENQESQPGTATTLPFTLVSTSTAVIKVSPGEDAAVQALMNEVQGIWKYARDRGIKSTEDIKAATNDLSIIQQLRKRITEKQKEYLDPIKKHVAEVTDAFKLLLEPLMVADKITRDKVLEYRDTLRKLEEARRQAEELQAKLEDREPEAVAVVNQPSRYHAELGTTGTAKIWKWEVEDFAEVPDQYKMLDGTKVGKVIRAGGSIPGVKAWQEESLRVTS